MRARRHYSPGDDTSHRRDYSAVFTAQVAHPGIRARLAPLIVTSAFERGVLAMRVALADRLGSLQLLRVGVQRLLSLARLFLDLAGLDKAPLRLVVFARRGLVALALIALAAAVLGSVLFLLLVLHASSPGVTGDAGQTGQGGATVPPPPVI